MPTKVTARQLWEFLTFDGASQDFKSYKEAVDGDLLEDEEPSGVTEAEFDAMKKADLNQIIADQNMSENHVGGDDIVSACDSVIDAIKDGYTVLAWYGESAEALVVGYKMDELRVVG